MRNGKGNGGQRVSHKVAEQRLANLKQHISDTMTDLGYLKSQEDFRTKGKGADKIVDIVNANDDIKSRIGSLSGCLEVVHSLAYNGIKVPTRKTVTVTNSIDGVMKKTRGEVESVGAIVGYIIRNIGDREIHYYMETYHYSEKTQKYESETVVKIIQPGEEAQISKVYFNMLLLMPEFNCRIANGKIISKGMYPPAKADPTEELMASLGGLYFVFTNGEKVHDSAGNIKIPIAELIEDQENNTRFWSVLPEYIQCFGGLNNHKNITYYVPENKPSQESGFVNPEDMAAYMSSLEEGLF